MEYQGLFFVITMDRTFVLYRKGFQYFHDIWDPGRKKKLEWKEVQLNSLLQRSIMIVGSSC